MLPTAQGGLNIQTAVDARRTVRFHRLLTVRAQKLYAETEEPPLSDPAGSSEFQRTGWPLGRLFLKRTLCRQPLAEFDPQFIQDQQREQHQQHADRFGGGEDC